MRVRETELPGIGSRYTVQFEDGSSFVVLIENGGRRRAYWRPGPDADSEKLFELSDSEARKMGEIFDGTYFHPVDEGLDEVLEGARIKWIKLTEDSPLVGATIGDSQVRNRTGVSIIAVQRGDRTISSPDQDEVLQGEDVLVVVGTDEQHASLTGLLD